MPRLFTPGLAIRAAYLAANGLKPHLVKTFKLSNDPHFIEKLEDVVGLYLNPPEHALVFCIDEKSQIQAPCSSQGQACMGL